MTSSDALEEWLGTISEQAGKRVGLDAAIVGSVDRCGGIGPILCYDYDLMVEELVKGGMEYEEAVEFVDYNIVGTYVGPGTPFAFYRAPSRGGVNE